MFNFVNMFLIALAFLVICVGIHIVAMALVKEQAMNHMGLVVQAFLAGLTFYLLCRFVPPLHKICCEMEMKS